MGSGTYKAHESLDPLKNKTLEAREHPLIVGFDSTGSMGSVPRTAQKNLTSLYKKYVRVPLQISQFESDNRCPEAVVLREVIHHGTLPVVAS